MINTVNKYEIPFQQLNQSISLIWNRGWEKYTTFSHGPYYNAIVPICSAVNKIIYLNTYFYKEMPPSNLSKDFYNFIQSHSITNSIYNFIVSGPLVNAINFIMLGSLFLQTFNNIEERKQAKLSGDKEKIIDANIKAFILAGNYFYTPTTLKDILLALKVPVSTCLQFAAHTCQIAYLFLSTAQIFQTGFRLRSTAKVIENLKRTRHLAFMTAYNIHLSEAEKEALDQLTTPLLKSKVRAAKSHLKKSGKASRLEHLIHVSNLAFIQATSQVIQKDPENLDKHFNIYSKRVTPLGGSDFLEQIVSKKSQNFNTDLSESVLSIKKRLSQKIHSDFFLIGSNCINLIPLSITLIALFTAVNPMIAAAAAATSLVIAVASLVHSAVTEMQKRAFLNRLEKVICNS